MDGLVRLPSWTVARIKEYSIKALGCKAQGPDTSKVSNILLNAYIAVPNSLGGQLVLRVPIQLRIYLVLIIKPLKGLNTTPCILQENLRSTFWQQESPAAGSLGLRMSRPAKSAGRSWPTPPNRHKMN